MQLFLCACFLVSGEMQPLLLLCFYSTEHLTASYPGSARNSAAGSLASSRESSASQGPAPYRVLMLGAPAVGKSSLVSQFMTSEHMLVYDTSIGELFPIL